MGARTYQFELHWMSNSGHFVSRFAHRFCFPLSLQSPPKEVGAVSGMPRPALCDGALASSGSINADAFSPEPKAVPGSQPCFIRSRRPMLDSGSGWGFGGFSGVGEGAEVELEEAADGELLLGLGAPGESSGEL